MKTWNKLPPLSPLTAPQIKRLCALAGVAFKRAKERGGIDDGETVETFRHREQLASTKLSSLKAMNQGHYRALKGHWLMLIGLLGEAFDLLVKTGAGQEQRELLQHQISEAAANLALAFHARGQSLESAAAGSWAYIIKLARDKFGGRDLKGLTTEELVDLRNTTINRTNAMRGKGDASRRNKSQRAVAE